jgi:DNA polymerase-3 subunit epsilon
LVPSLDALRLWHLVRPRTLSHASREFLGREHAGAHDAMADINVTMDVIDVIMQDPMFDGLGMTQLRCLQWPTDPNALDQKGKIAWNHAGQPVLTFGKHKGEALASIPRNYFKYLAQQDFADDAKAIFQAAAEGRFPVRE